MTLFLDIETFSPVPIKHGTHRYAEEAEVIIVQWAIDEDPVTVWDLTDGTHPDWQAELQALIDGAGCVVIHNSPFERTVLRRHGIHIPLDKIEDTMLLALLHSLPGKLEQICDILGVGQDQAKDKRGKRLIQLFTKPRPKNIKLRRATRETHPAEWQEFLEYAERDVVATRAIHKLIPRWNYSPRERRLWRLDQAVNDDGFLCDTQLAHAARRAFDRAAGTLAAAARAATGGAVNSATQRERLLEYLKSEHGLEIADLQKATLEKLMRGDLRRETRELLEIRQQACATSPAKYGALAASTSFDGRLRGAIQFSGAARTRRDCLAEGTPVLVKTAEGCVEEKPIETVLTSDMVWDGDAWVRHEGVVFSGDKDVIEHDGVVATAEHIVYISTTESMTLGEAKQKGAKLWAGNATPYTN